MTRLGQMFSKNQFSFEEIAELVGAVEKVEEIQRCLKNAR